MDQLAGKISQPCVVAIVGRMKTGKSSFLNALLKEDLAKVGATETTATINHFVYGTPDDGNPVTCYWKNGKITSESKEFLDSLQGNDEATLQKALDIDYLEYSLENEYLRDVVLVDTPGMCTTVDEHKDKTATFLKLAKQLRKQHDKNSKQIQQQADAVVYLLGEVAREKDKALLDDFREATSGQSNAFNAVGVLAKVDVSPKLLSRRHEFSKHMAKELKDVLNTVLPVSAGIRRALDRIDSGSLPALEQYAEQLCQIPKKHQDKLLDQDELYLHAEQDAWPVNEDERERLIADLPWGVFVQIARAVIDADGNMATAREVLEDLSGFDAIVNVLNEHLFKRSRFLRHYQTVMEATRLIMKLRFEESVDATKRDQKVRHQRERFLSFVENAQGDQDVRKELAEYLDQHGPRTNHAERVNAVYQQISGGLAVLKSELDGYNEDFVALQHIHRYADHFSSDETDELRALFGMYGTKLEVCLRGKPEHAGERQNFWRNESQVNRHDERRAAAAQAEETYGRLMAQLVDR
jgi:GTPase Era involved in 16S rRNA processing